MSWNAASILQAIEVIEFSAVLLCLLMCGLTLSDAIGVRRRMAAQDLPDTRANRGARLQIQITVRGRICLVGVQLMGLALGADRLWTIFTVPPASPARWLIYGAGRTLMSVFVAAVALMNMRGFRQLSRESKQP